MTIAELKRHRELQRVSQLELGRRSGVSAKRICMAERQHVTLREDEVAALVTGLRMVLRDRERQVNAGMAKLGVSQGRVALAALVGAHPEAEARR